MFLRLPVVGLALAVIVLCACDNSSSAAPGVLDPSTASDAGKSAKLKLYERIFDDDTIRRYDLVVDPESLATIDADPTQEQYVGGTLVVEGDTMRHVGVRYKGSEGAWYECVEYGPGGGAKTCPLSMQIKINRANKDTTFFGLKDYQLHALNDDPSKLIQRIGYWFYREMGVPAPRVAQVELWINGAYEGLYSHVEQIDGRFAKHHFQDGSGNLYKEIWPLAYTGKAQAAAALQAGLKTNEEAGSVEGMLSFGQKLEAAPSQDSVRKIIESRMDLDEVTSMVAVMYSLDDDDGMFHWYALDPVSADKSRPHNFYWYDTPGSGKLHLIPWDDDKMLERVAQPDTFNAVELRDGWGETSHDCKNYGQSWRQRSAACDILVKGLASYEALYKAKLLQLYNGPFSRIDAVVQKWESQLAMVIERNQTKSPHAISLSRWQAGIQNTKAELAAAKSILATKVGK